MQVYLPIAGLPVDMFVLLGMGVGVGFVSGMFGIGGGFLMTPLLIFVGIPPAVAVATETAQIAASSTTGALFYWRKRALDLKLGMVLLVGGLIGTVLGVLFFNAMRRQGQLDTVIVLSYLVLLSGIGFLMLIESVRAMISTRRGKQRTLRKAGRHAWYEGLPLKMRFHRSGLYISVIPLMALSTFIGFAGAVLGIGGGFLLVPALIYVFRVKTAVVVGTSLFQVLFTMIATVTLHAVTNHSVDLVLAAILVVGGVFGAQFGARVGANLRGEYFRLLLALLVFGVGMRFALDVLVPPKEPFSAGATETGR